MEITVHLDTLILTRFKSCKLTKIKLQPDLAVLVGPNSGGKSNLIDALRLLTPPLNGRRDRYPEPDDLQRGSTETNLLIEGHFSSLSVAQKGLLVSDNGTEMTSNAILKWSGRMALHRARQADAERTGRIIQRQAP